ncbi:MAG TPA: hypothetical protein VJS92_00730 [Candidatus Polarisedimenticolaceae bacterium]|nr:hypothetical protein [Candidatus Polarisedimenticolaceae bacterium]
MGRPHQVASFFDQIVAEQHDFFPTLELFPQLLPADVERFVALGEEGSRRLRSSDLAGAEAAFRGQIALYSLNPAPYVSRAIVAASRHDDKQALAQLRAAVVRGFTDLMRIERAEAWLRLAHHREFRALQDAVPLLVAAEARWAGLDAFYAAHAPRDLASVNRQRERRRISLELMAPALGPRQTRLWQRLNERSAAALIEAYVAAAPPQAADLEPALMQLMELYAGGSMLRWQQLPAEVAARLGRVATLAL